MDNAQIQLYYGWGKGKTTAAVGSAVRAAGRGFKVLFYQFLKSPSSGEVSVLKQIGNIEYMDNSVHNPFLFNLTPDQQAYYNSLYVKEISKLKEKIFSGNYDMVVLDEVVDAFNLGIIPSKDLFEIIDKKPSTTELIITGHPYEGISIDDIKIRCDYITEFKKEKHPFDKGLTARTGIEE